MTDVTRILSAIEHGDRQAADQLLPLVYEELRKLAAQKLIREAAGQTLQPTALVHEAYVRLVAGEAEPDAPGRHWEGRGHFFSAAAEAMRRILIENARRKKRHKHGGGRHRVELEEEHLAVLPTSDRLLALDEALEQLAEKDPKAAEVVKLHFFAGLSFEEVGACVGVSRATVKRQWAYARAWLRCAMRPTDEPAGA